MTDDEAKDRDETRRLLYMAIAAHQTDRYELAGTLINAIRHHQGAGDDDLENRVITLIKFGTPDAVSWAADHISRLTDEIAGD